jgi:hypothetical protein
MKTYKKSVEKRTKARQEARPKKVMEIFGWVIMVDERQYITKSEKEDNRYFSTLENALWHIAEQSEKGKTYDELKDAVITIRRIKANFLTELSTALHSVGLE